MPHTPHLMTIRITDANGHLVHEEVGDGRRFWQLFHAMAGSGCWVSVHEA